jgi:N6-adenosine-specific RNA methylase IME4
MFDELPKNHFGAILADPPWRYQAWNKTEVVKAISKSSYKSSNVHYRTMTTDEISALPVESLIAENSALFLWVTWPMLLDGLRIMADWGFTYKTCAFNWMKAHAGQVEMFQEEITPLMKMGYWTRASSEVCLLGIRGNPKRVNADVRQGIISPVREHSRKPDGIHERIERLVAGPYLELFARQKRPNWTVWGNETDKFPEKQQDSWHEMWSKPFHKPEFL